MMFCLFMWVDSFAYTEVTIGELKYELSGTEAFVSGYVGNPTDVVIPATIETNGQTFRVTQVNVRAFDGCSSLTSVKADGNNLITINARAFANCTSLKKVWFPSIVTISRVINWSPCGAFSNCTSLTYVVIPATCVSIDNGKSSGTYDYEHAFSGCSRLQAIIYLGDKDFGKLGSNAETYTAKDIVKWGSSEFQYSGIAPVVTFASNLPVDFTFRGSNSVTLANKDAGIYTQMIPFTFTNDGWTFDADVPYTYTINKVPLTAKVADATREYGEDNPEFNIIYYGFVGSDDESVLTTLPTFSTTAQKTSNVGEYPITISGGSATNYEFAYEPGVLTVTKALLSAKVNDATKVYGSNNPSFSIEYYGLKNNETVPAWTRVPAYQTSATKSSGVGKYEVNAINAVPKNYDLGEITPGTLFITPAPLTIKANNVTRQYYNENPTLSYTCSGFVNSDNNSVLSPAPTLSTTANLTSNVGTYVIMPSGAEAQNYNITYKSGELTITKRPLEVTSHSSRQYGEENTLLPIEYNGFVNNENESVIAVEPVATTTAQVTSSVGDYQIKLSGGEAVNYYFVYKQGVLTVTKAPLSAKVNDATKVYGSSNPSFTMEYFGLRNNETIPTWTTQPTYQTSATKSSGVGQYEVNATNAMPTNYDLGEITPGTLFVTPAPLTIKANNAIRQYYNENPTLSYTCSGFVNSDNNSVLSPAPTLSTTANLTSNVGNYPIEIEGASSPNYSIFYVNGTLTVTQRTLMASVGNYQRVYNEDNPEFEVIYSGFVGDDNENVLIRKPVASTSATKTSNAGTYTINVSGGNDDNYKFSYTSGTLTINKAEQTISWNQDLSGLEVGDQVELKAIASSGLPITYTMDTEAAELYSAGSKTYLDCMADGQFLIRAIQNGNNNYYSSPRASKTVTIIGGNSPSGPTLTFNQADNGTISMQVSKGKAYTFTIAPNDGWKIHSVMFNNSDVTNKLSTGNQYTTPAITGDSWLFVVYEKIDEDAISFIPESNVKIQGTSFGARVIDAEMGDMIRVYTTDGKLQHSVKVDSSSVDIPLEKDNVYIIQVGTKTIKLGC